MLSKRGASPSEICLKRRCSILSQAEIKGEAEAVALICPLISEEMSDSEQALEAADHRCGKRR